MFKITSMPGVWALPLSSLVWLGFLAIGVTSDSPSHWCPTTEMRRVACLRNVSLDGGPPTLRRVFQWKTQMVLRCCPGFMGPTCQKACFSCRQWAELTGRLQHVEQFLARIPSHQPTGHFQAYNPDLSARTVCWTKDGRPVHGDATAAAAVSAGVVGRGGGGAGDEGYNGGCPTHSRRVSGPGEGNPPQMLRQRQRDSSFYQTQWQQQQQQQQQQLQQQQRQRERQWLHREQQLRARQRLQQERQRQQQLQQQQQRERRQQSDYNQQHQQQQQQQQRGGHQKKPAMKISLDARRVPKIKKPPTYFPSYPELAAFRQPPEKTSRFKAAEMVVSLTSSGPRGESQQSTSSTKESERSQSGQTGQDAQSGELDPEDRASSTDQEFVVYVDPATQNRLSALERQIAELQTKLNAVSSSMTSVTSLQGELDQLTKKMAALHGDVDHSETSPEFQASQEQNHTSSQQQEIIEKYRKKPWVEKWHNRKTGNEGRTQGASMATGSDERIKDKDQMQSVSSAPEIDEIQASNPGGHERSTDKNPDRSRDDIPSDSKDEAEQQDSKLKEIEAHLNQKNLNSSLLPDQLISSTEDNSSQRCPSSCGNRHPTSPPPLPDQELIQEIFSPASPLVDALSKGRVEFYRELKKVLREFEAKETGNSSRGGSGAQVIQYDGRGEENRLDVNIDGKSPGRRDDVKRPTPTGQPFSHNLAQSLTRSANSASFTATHPRNSLPFITVSIIGCFLRWKV